MKVQVILHIQWNPSRMGVAYNEDFIRAIEANQIVSCLIITYVGDIRWKGVNFWHFHHKWFPNFYRKVVTVLYQRRCSNWTQFRMLFILVTLLSMEGRTYKIIIFSVIYDCQSKSTIWAWKLFGFLLCIPILFWQTLIYIAVYLGGSKAEGGERTDPLS